MPAMRWHDVKADFVQIWRGVSRSSGRRPGIGSTRRCCWPMATRTARATSRRTARVTARETQCRYGDPGRLAQREPVLGALQPRPAGFPGRSLPVGCTMTARQPALPRLRPTCSPVRLSRPASRTSRAARSRGLAVPQFGNRRNCLRRWCAGSSGVPRRCGRADHRRPEGGRLSDLPPRIEALCARDFLRALTQDSDSWASAPGRPAAIPAHGCSSGAVRDRIRLSGLIRADTPRITQHTLSVLMADLWPSRSSTVTLADPRRDVRQPQLDDRTAVEADGSDAAENSARRRLVRRPTEPCRAVTAVIARDDDQQRRWHVPAIGRSRRRCSGRRGESSPGTVPNAVPGSKRAPRPRPAPAGCRSPDPPLLERLDAGPDGPGRDGEETRRRGAVRGGQVATAGG